MSSVLDNVLEMIHIYSNHTNHKYVHRESFKWDLVHDFVLCRTIDLSRYFDLDSVVPKQIILLFNRIPNLGVAIYLIDKNKYMKRPLKTAMLDYSGPVIAVEDLNSPKYKNIILSITQFIDSEYDRDKNCVNYPHRAFKSYADCDANFVYNQFNSKYKPLMPFWATDNLTEVTSLR